MSGVNFLENLLDGILYQWKALGDIGTFIRGSGIQKSDFTEPGAGCIHYGQIHTHYGTWATETKSFIDREFSARLRKAHAGDLVIATRSEDDEAVAKAVAWLGDEDVAVSTDAYIYRHAINPKYMSYFFQLEGWTTTLPQHFTPAQIIELYCDHGTHEQFHSEFKTDMDLERLPSGKFDTNFLVCALAAVAMNILRLIGQSSLTGQDAPIRHKAKRRRIKTVLQELMFKAGRMIKHAGRWVLGLGENDTAFTVFERLYSSLVPTRQPPPPTTA